MHGVSNSGAGTQAEHDARHPGLRCRNCPDTIQGEIRLRQWADDLRRPWWKRLFRPTPKI